jgi:hypothetical protein
VVRYPRLIDTQERAISPTNRMLNLFAKLNRLCIHLTDNGLLSNGFTIHENAIDIDTILARLEFSLAPDNDLREGAVLVPWGYTSANPGAAMAVDPESYLHSKFGFQ